MVKYPRGENMSKGTIILAIIMGWTLLIVGGLTYLIVKKKEYSLLSGYSNRPEEEKQYLKENGYIDKVGKYLTYTFYLLALAFILTLFNVPYGTEVGFGLLTLFILGGLVYIQKFEVPRKRKKYLWVSGSFSIVIILAIGILFFIGSMENDVNITENTFEITGMYGIEWELDEIIHVELMDVLPEVEYKANGFATSNILKGKFRLEEPYGRGLLFIEKGLKPYLFIEKEDNFVFLNRENAEETIQIYNELKQMLKEKSR
jgi:hypothetical protein